MYIKNYPMPMSRQTVVENNVIQSFRFWYLLHKLLIIVRAYPGSEFVVASTLAKSYKLGPNEIDFSHGLS